MIRVDKIISGGQTGVDQAALEVALKFGLGCGGWCPPGRVCEAGIIPLYYPLQETPEDRSENAPGIPRSQRTEWNVRDSDATLILTPDQSASDDTGTDWTRICALNYQKPLLICDPWDNKSKQMIEEWLGSLKVETLNIAGPSENTINGIGNQAYNLLSSVFS